MEYAVVDKSKKRVSQKKDKPAAEYDDVEVENKATKVSVLAMYVCMYDLDHLILHIHECL